MERKKIGLALSGGAARGFAHIGVIKEFEKAGIPIDFVSGTSAGSFCGGAYASGMSMDEMIEMGRSVSWYRMSSFALSPKGFISNKPIAKMIKANFPETRFEDLKIPFAAVATNLETGDEKVFSKNGDMGLAICASCAIPGVFAPVKGEDGSLYVDGGVVAPIPVKAVKELGAEIVIAVDVLSCGSSYWGKPTSVFGVVFQSAMMLLRTASLNQHIEADVLVLPDVAHLRPDEIGKMDEFIELGEKAGVKAIDEIKRLACL